MDTQRERVPRFADPLGAAAGGRAAEALARRTFMFLYAVSAATLAITLLTPDSDTSDHHGIAVVMLCMAFSSVLLRGWRNPPSWLLFVSFPLGVVTVSALVAVARPTALIPMFYIWPNVLAAYFLARRWVAGMLALTGAAYGVVLVAWAVPDARMIQWISVVVVIAVLDVLIVALKEGLHTMLSRLHLLATRDPLTGALNRRAFGDALDAAVARAARRDGAGVAVALLDVDHFKAVNDAFGHAVGDRALCHLVSVLQERARAGDVVGRLGGEEFAVLLDGTDVAGATAFAESLRADLAAGAPADLPTFTISIGIAELDDSAERMLIAADRALYAAKAAGRDRVLAAA